MRVYFAWLIALLGVSLGCKGTEVSEKPWAPGTVHPSDDAPRRGLLDVRGLIHAHSIYSHDACDNRPVIDGQPNAQCLDDFRDGLCYAQHDFVLLTDHEDRFAFNEFPEVLLHQADRGDRLVERNGSATASWMACPGGRSALIMAGTEANLMPVGLEHHITSDPDERERLYTDASQAAIDQFRESGALVLIAHTEDWTVEELLEIDVDGFEMYNLHANTFLNSAVILDMAIRLYAKEFEGLPHPEVSVLPVLSEDPRYLDRWSAVVAAGRRRVTTMGTDCHRNSFAMKMQDGERVDSYRRMMIWLSNHLLVQPDADGTWDDRHLKEALSEGRLYGAFDVLGYPQGFDFHAEFGDETAEMGAEIRMDQSPRLLVSMPTVGGLSPNDSAPELSVRILLATVDGWEEVAKRSGDLSYEPTRTGAYRAEIRMRPRHLHPYLGENADDLAEMDRPWVYSNPIYVR